MGCSSQTLRSFSSCFSKQFLKFFLKTQIILFWCFAKTILVLFHVFFFKLGPNVFSMFFLFFFFFKTVFGSEKQGEPRKYK